MLPEAAGEAMVAAFDANAANAALMASLQADAAVAESGLAALEAELAAEEIFVSSLEAAEAMELAGGPLGWIAAAVTGGLLLATAVTIVYMMNKIAQSQTNLTEIQNKISNMPKIPMPQPPTIVPTPPILTKPVTDILNTIPDGPVVSTSEVFDCHYNHPFSRCNRNKKRHPR